MQLFTWDTDICDLLVAGHMRNFGRAPLSFFVACGQFISRLNGQGSGEHCHVVGRNVIPSASGPLFHFHCNPSPGVSSIGRYEGVVRNSPMYILISSAVYLVAYVHFSKARSECSFVSQWQVGSCTSIFQSAVQDARSFFFIKENVRVDGCISSFARSCTSHRRCMVFCDVTRDRTPSAFHHLHGHGDPFERCLPAGPSPHVRFVAG